MLRFMVLSLFALGLMALVSCQGHDLGQQCPGLELDSNAADEDGNQSVSQEVVEQNVSFPCESLICVASGGRSGYCSKKCRDDNGCPDGFACQTLQPTGPFSQEKFCTWRSCQNHEDCASSAYCCNTVVESGPEKGQTYCGFNNGGACE